MDLIKQLFYLINEYQNGKYSTKDFCNYFADIYNHEVDKTMIDNRTNDYFKSICLLTSRYSWYEEDIINFRDYFIDEITFRERFFELVKNYRAR